MNTGPEGAALRATCADDQLSAADAVAWFAPGAPPGSQVIGYALGARAATWLRVLPDRSVETVPAAGDVLAGAYEMVLFDGERELRWLRTPDGRGTAVAVGEDPAKLPPGRDVTAHPPPRRGCDQTRLLDGAPSAHRVDGWTTLRSERYAIAHLPVTFTGGEVLAIETVEYVAEDEHGNLDVADTRTLGLRATTTAAVQVMAAAPASGQEGTTA